MELFKLWSSRCSDKGERVEPGQESTQLLSLPPLSHTQGQCRFETDTKLKNQENSSGSNQINIYILYDMKNAEYLPHIVSFCVSFNSHFFSKFSWETPLYISFRNNNHQSFVYFITSQWCNYVFLNINFKRCPCFVIASREMNNPLWSLQFLSLFHSGCSQ